jgi:rRNA-processing protein FCF1
MKRILVDTNFLIDLTRFRVGLEELSDILTESYRIFTLSATLRELERIAKDCP